MEQTNLYSDLYRMQLIFNEIQGCDSKRYSESLNEVIEILNTQELLNEFCRILDTILVCKKPSIPLRILNFLRRTFEDVSEDPSRQQFIIEIFSYLIQAVDSRMHKVRRNSLSVIGLLLDVLQPSTIDSVVIQKLCERLFDKDKGVRKETIRVLSGFQGSELNRNVKVVNLFKDILRYDPNNDVRMFMLSVISVEQSTYNCVIERCMDMDESIRKMFYGICLPKIDMKELSADKRVFLMERAVVERDFDAKGKLVDVLLSVHCLPEQLEVLVDEFYDTSALGHLETLLRSVFDRVGCSKSFEYVISRPTEKNTFLYLTELQYIEEKDGRDALCLPEIDEFVSVMYESCMSVMECTMDESRREMVNRMRNLFRIAKMYDLFSDTSRRCIQGIIYKLLAKSCMEEIVEEVVDEAMQITSVVCDTDLNSFIGSVVKKSMHVSPGICLMVCKQVMRHIRPFSSLHSAIVDEIVVPNIENGGMVVEVLEIGFFYVLERDNAVIVQGLIDAMSDSHRVWCMCVDLAIYTRNQTILIPVEEYARDILERFDDEQMIIPVSKLILSGCVSDNELKEMFVKFALAKYYCTDDDHLKQYCSVMFFEMFCKDSSILIEVFCDIIESINECSYKVFISQSLYWIGNSKYVNGSQQLFYKICIRLAAENGDERYKKLLLGVLDSIDVLACWESCLTKKIIFCCSIIAKRLGNRLNLGDSVTRLMEVDDGEPISKEDLESAKIDLGIK
ncbi:chromosome condensation complex Condensin [Ordospora colligata]|uniref:Chromosome condensation complex Condensin n=1 Tax=Ordospora colligata OC4 TaxID=1354746 RepID=A0A0B2UIS3_9MICR|nr:chromosome condensation complex Condensin [Ordospora colligata OC4]KHN69134.1 chromosome condensation complex Condensin [Ordospora colligata OC4]TBU14589.1 chromosome condensation complex Condensin [Ordospora colligata]TBU14783.1 chromosome condensation complex Condensin [Ordospora colligata]TBU18217.1 chromosome condensation complex Condensin [Ordospora colligata]